MSREYSWRALVVQADPDFMQRSENPVEYEFTGPSGKAMRQFRGRYKQRGPYAPVDAADNGLMWNGTQITLGGIPLAWDED